MVQFTDQTQGLEFAFPDETTSIEYVNSDKGKIAVNITPKPATLPLNIGNIEPDDLSDFIDESSSPYLLIDARSKNKFNFGHIPSAISIPLQTLQSNQKILDNLKAKDKKLIFYSDGPTCALCTEAARLASEEGYQDIKVMLSGVQGWERNGGNLAVSDEMIKNSHVVLIDTRPAAIVQSGYISTAANLTAKDLNSEAEFDFPTKKDTPIVLYGTDNDIFDAEEVISGWGFKNILRVDGGLNGWKQRGNDVTSGAAPGSEGITWSPMPNNNIISVKQFKETLKKQSDELVIIDVRTAKESAKGKLKKSLNIPLENLASRLDEIPQGKTVITHCASGARAEMAAMFLSQFREDVRYLPAKVRCKDENCRIR